MGERRRQQPGKRTTQGETGEGAALRLTEIMAVLDCAKTTASRLRAGSYGHGGELAARYQALLAVSARLAGEQVGPGAICRACPREDCSGCRIAELVSGTE
jgi:hypothetical protein